MNICVAGLGLIGGSMCMALKRAGRSVIGWNRSLKPTEYALKNGIIDGVADNFLNFDAVFVALPPEAIIGFIDSNEFKDGAVLADICGVKKFIENGVYSRNRNFNYVGCHPMAGKEVSGIENACADLFDSASMVITSDSRTDKKALEVIAALTEEMGFKYIVRCTAETHDRKIAYTSQLAHVVSNAYVKDNEINGCIGFTGGSFQDMTRIAGVDETVWSSLYLNNAENLSEKISGLINSFSEIRSAIDGKNSEKLQSILRDGRLRFDSGKNLAPQPDIFVKKLK